MSRRYQDYSFRVAEVEGRVLTRLIGAVDKGKGDLPNPAAGCGSER